MQSPRTSSARLGSITALLLLIGVLCGVGLGALMIHVLHNTQQAMEAPAQPTAGPLLGLLIDGKLQVLSVGGSSPAARAGIRTGDLIEAVNGTAVSSVGAARQRVVAALQPAQGKPLLVTIRRAGRTLTLRLSIDLTASTSAPPLPTVTTADGSVYYL